MPLPTPGQPRNTHWTFLPLGSTRGGEDRGVNSAAVDRDRRIENTAEEDLKRRVMAAIGGGGGWKRGFGRRRSEVKVGGVILQRG